MPGSKYDPVLADVQEVLIWENMRGDAVPGTAASPPATFLPESGTRRG